MDTLVKIGKLVATASPIVIAGLVLGFWFYDSGYNCESRTGGTGVATYHTAVCTDRLGTTVPVSAFTGDPLPNGENSLLCVLGGGLIGLGATLLFIALLTDWLSFKPKAQAAVKAYGDYVERIVE